MDSVINSQVSSGLLITSRTVIMKNKAFPEKIDQLGICEQYTREVRHKPSVLTKYSFRMTHQLGLFRKSKRTTGKVYPRTAVLYWACATRGTAVTLLLISARARGGTACRRRASSPPSRQPPRLLKLGPVLLQLAAAAPRH
eukprot:6207458-Pleurochrysis_carterae.AAC.1